MVERQEYNRRIRARNHTYVDQCRAETVCAHCGAQPIEWHHPDHELPGGHRSRVCHLRNSLHSLKRIAAEIARCTPYCRRCHMREDGRLVRLSATRPFKLGDTEPPKPCVECHRLARPLRRGLCGRCYDRQRRPSLARRMLQMDAR